MKLYNDLKTVMPNLRKSGLTMELEVLKCVISDADRIIANKGSVEDSEVIKIIRKIIEGNSITMSSVDRPNNYILAQENDYLSKFLPKLLTEEEIRKLFNENLIGKPKNEVFKFFKQYPVDMATVAKVFESSNSQS